MNDTPRTDANDSGWQFNEQHGDFDSLSDNPMPWLDFAKMLERELTAVIEQRDRLAEALREIDMARLDDFMGPHDMALKCVSIAREALAAVKGGTK
jgi:hypothetical protein